MYGMKLERPLIDRTQINQVCRDVDKNAQPSNRRAPANNRNVMCASHCLFGVHKIKAIGFKHQSSYWNCEGSCFVLLCGVQYFRRVNTTSVAKPEVIRVWRKLTLSEWTDNDFPRRDSRLNLWSGEYHRVIRVIVWSRFPTGCESR